MPEHPLAPAAPPICAPPVGAFELSDEERERRAAVAAYDLRHRQKHALRETGRIPADLAGDLTAGELRSLELDLLRQIRDDDEAALAAEPWNRSLLDSAWRPGLEPDAAAAQPRPFAIDGFWIEGAMGVIAGWDKNGKSTLATELAFSLATGAPFLGLMDVLSEPAPVLVIQTENPDERVRWDLRCIAEARGLDYERDARDLIILDRPKPPAPRFNLLNDGHFDQLLAFANRNGIRYVILDPIYYLIGGENPTTWDTGPEVTTRLTRLNDAGVTPIVTNQLRAGTKFQFDAMLHPTLYLGWLECGALIRRKPGHDHNEFTIPVRFARDRDLDNTRRYELRGLGVGRWEWRSASDETETPAEPSKFERYKALHAEHPDWTTKQLAEALDTTDRSIRRYAERAGASDVA